MSMCLSCSFSLVIFYFSLYYLENSPIHVEDYPVVIRCWSVNFSWAHLV